MPTFRAAIGLGANLGEARSTLEQALADMARLPWTTVDAVSSCYQSKPVDAQGPDYVNAVVRLHTRLSPLALLDQLQKIEREQGRVRKDERWGPRTLDLDLLLYGEQVIQHERLIVPHYGMKEREFVLLPLAEIAPALVLPCGTPLTELVARCPRNGLEILADATGE